MPKLTKKYVYAFKLLLMPQRVSTYNLQQSFVTAHSYQIVCVILFQTKSILTPASYQAQRKRTEQINAYLSQSIIETQNAIRSITQSSSSSSRNSTGNSSDSDCGSSSSSVPGFSSDSYTSSSEVR